MKRKWIFRSLLGLMLILIAALVAAAFSLGAIVKRGVERIGPAATQSEVKLKNAEVWLLAWRVRLTGIMIGNPAGYRTPSALEAASITVRFKPASLFSDKLVVQSIKVKDPVLTWEGGLGITIWAKKPRAKPRTRPGKPPSASRVGFVPGTNHRLGRHPARSAPELGRNHAVTFAEFQRKGAKTQRRKQRWTPWRPIYQTVSRHQETFLGSSFAPSRLRAFALNVNCMVT
jgi:hypothetical protein